MFVTRYLRATVYVVLAGMFPAAVPASADTSQFLNAPLVKSVIAVRWDDAGKAMQWEADYSGAFRAIQSDSLFLTKSSIFIVYPKMNPLVKQATASATAVADPGFTALTTLITAITSVAQTVAPAQLPDAANKAKVPTAANAAKPLGPADPCSDPGQLIGSLTERLYGSEAKPFSVDPGVWIKDIDAAFIAGMSGPAAIGQGASDIANTADSLKMRVTDAQALLKTITGCAAKATDTNLIAIYDTVLLARPDQRIQDLSAAEKAASQLSSLLTSKFGAEDKWTGSRKTYFIISDEILPTFDKMQNVTVKVSNESVKISSALLPSVEDSAGGQSTFSVRKYSSFVPEIGVGAVFGTIKTPVYGTGTDVSGKTIVTRKPDGSISVNPSVLANFVCRCGTGLLAPMFQIGAATSKDLPAILTGAGVRLFGLGKGDVAVGGGAMFAWYKDLQKLHVGDVITGTTDINNDLGYRSSPKIGGYFAIQYKF